MPAHAPGPPRGGSGSSCGEGVLAGRDLDDAIPAGGADEVPDGPAGVILGGLRDVRAAKTAWGRRSGTDRRVTISWFGR